MVRKQVVGHHTFTKVVESFLKMSSLMNFLQTWLKNLQGMLDAVDNY